MIYIISEFAGPGVYYYNFIRFANIKYAKHFLSIGENVAVLQLDHKNAKHYKKLRKARKDLNRLAYEAYKRAQRDKINYLPGSEIKKRIKKGLFITQYKQKSY